METILDFILHIDVHLAALTAQYGMWTYAILFLIVFAETGLVVTPFLPGDSMLFAAGAICSLGSMDVTVLMGLLMIAAVLGDGVNYAIGKKVGPRLFTSSTSKFLNKQHLDRTHAFYEKHGGKTIILARFMPIIRTFAPFVAGVGSMRYRTFFIYNVVGAIVWVASFTMLGFFFGNQPLVKKNFTLVIGAIIVISVLPAIWEIIRSKKEL
ncbi:MAG: DedA family protein [Candidatus Kapabacteria bacterium]|nr:DedA family protein [Ignavibacteria bacterium]MBP6508916.1 DedA family protein [Candidatus Kapabacteria bacterium]MBK7034430.1 DedA family protein [Ignavibacteria bacterium]MBK7412838.1 DedA family protein [Ignavibacteria bacterium]MBK7578490.1 DedA family protein [Ignavibacteria bacterium]